MIWKFRLKRFSKCGTKEIKIQKVKYPHIAHMVREVA
jgi:hypothetical protein